MKTVLFLTSIIAFLVIVNWICSGVKSEKRSCGEVLGIPDRKEVEEFDRQTIESYTLDKCNSEDSNHQGNCLKCNADFFTK